MMETLLLIVLPVCLGISFLCSGMEAGLFTLGRWRVAQQMRAGQKRAARLYAYLQNTENFLWTVLIANTLALFGAMWIVALALLRAFPQQHFLFWISFSASAFVFYGFCDLLPKTLFRKFPNRLCLWLSAPFRLLHLVLSPLVAIIEGITALLLHWTGGRIYKGQVFNSRNELRLLMEDTSGTLTHEERSMVNRVFDLNNLSVRQIALPFARFPGLTTTDLVSDALGRFRESPENVIPVWKLNGRQRGVAGFVEAKSLIFRDDLRQSEGIENHMTAALYLNEDIRLHEALRRLQRAGKRIAVVLGRDRREIGIVTLEEILKVIFGEVKL